MTTLIAVYNSSGLVGRCDAKCYNAKEPDCDCICGGRNHGAGLEQATENTRDRVEQWVEAYAKEKGLTDYKAILNREHVDQVSLFPLANFSKTLATKKRGHEPRLSL